MLVGRYLLSPADAGAAARSGPAQAPAAGTAASTDRGVATGAHGGSASASPASMRESIHLMMTRAADPEVSGLIAMMSVDTAQPAAAAQDVFSAYAANGDDD